MRKEMPESSARSRVCNVLVIGSGAAGLRAAIAATEAGSQVLVVGKRHRLDAHTVLAAGGVCCGAYGFGLVSGDRTVFEADAVILATGGHTRLWRRSSSRRDENYGEGMSLALEAGCRLMDMELVQFHPTGMLTPEEMAGTLVTEAVRGEGGRLYNRDHERFMQRYDPQRMELSARDRVALAIYTEIMQGRGGPNGGVFLDISHRPKDEILEKLPRMYRQFIEYQMLDISKLPMEVAPTAHYSMGGLAVDPETHATEVVGLYAAGECTSGLHGANRLGGNSLAETVIFGRRAGVAAAAHSQVSEVQRRSKTAVQEAADELQRLIKPGSELARPLQRALRNLMWEHCGVVRDEAGMRDGLRKLADLGNAAQTVDIRPGQEGWFELAHVLDLRAGLRTAEATLRCALECRESRGAHNRSDFPALDPGLERNFYTRVEGGDRPLRVWSEPVPAIPATLKRMLTDEEMEVAGRLLE